MTVKVVPASRAEEKRNVKAGQAALARAKSVIVVPGVTIGAARGVPLFHVDPDRPDRIVRILNEKTDIGRFVNGKFKKSAL
ncbi:MAG: hypothetical protein HYV27_16425 [Candidatus Hydrogenedentes bacterium]|nr:hypothetical protein [Candidatus Hydrogenedentota bacterium]